MNPEQQKEAAEKLKSGKTKSLKQTEREAKKQNIAEQHIDKEKRNPPIIHIGCGIKWLAEQDKCDLLLTDTTNAGSGMYVYQFVDSWLYNALDRVKPTGSAYICIRAEPIEVETYLAIDEPRRLRLPQILVWTGKNTQGDNPKDLYNPNYLIVLFYRGNKAPDIDIPKKERCAVVDVSTPDELAERFIRHTTKPGDVVFDPFAGSGSFLLAASRLGRIGRGAVIDAETATIAAKRGCVVKRHG